MRNSSGQNINRAKPLSMKARLSLGVICGIAVCALLVGASSLTFVFETGSILYKLGTDKTLLRTGKVIGLIAAVLLLFQLILSARFKLLDRIFALNRLYIYHRVNASVIAILAVIHPLLVFAPEDIGSIPIEIKYWPEVLGALLLILIGLITATGLWRKFLDFSFDRWWIFHRAAAFIASVMLFFHILYGSETFEAGMARYIIIASAGAYAVIFGWIKVKPFILRQKPWTVTSVTKTGQHTVSVELAPHKTSEFNYIPGQFAFVSFTSETMPPEEHPFTISSTPSRPESLQFTIRCSGDWTALISNLKPGDSAIIDGPYGRFSYGFLNEFNEYIMIAGGIGITPMLSMLRYMADRDNTKKVTLIWSNRTREDVVYPDEFVTLQKRLNGLVIHYLFTRQKGAPSGTRLDRTTLNSILSVAGRQTPVFICGPPVMMDSVRKDILKIGFSKKLVFTEEFQL